MADKKITQLQGDTHFLVTARKWRPKTFADVTSQEFITTTIRNSIKSGRISHAYLLCGPRGVGKTTVARLLAKSLNCQKPTGTGEPCNNCPSCDEINDDNRSHPDVFEIDGASNRNIEDVRELKEKVKYGPIRSKYKIFIIDEVHMLTGASFNALLKTLEEPPRYIVFIFATTAPEKVPLTILGRCQRYDFKRIKVDEIIERLKQISKAENIKIDNESLFFIAKKGDGSMRDAQGIFDMAAAYCGNNIKFDNIREFFNLVDSDVYFKITELIKTKNSGELLDYFEEIMNRGYDMQTFLEGLTAHYRNLLVALSTKSADLIIESETVKEKYKQSIGSFSEIEILNSLKLILQTETVFKYSSNQRILIEALLIELLKYTDTKEISEIAEELKKLKTGSEKPIPESSIPVRTENAAGVNVRYTQPATQPIIQTQHENISSIPVTPPPLTTQSIHTTITSGEINSHWTAIKNLIGTEKKWIHSIIKDTSIEFPEANTVKLAIEDNKLEVVTSYKDYLTKKISDYFGRSITLSFIRYTDATQETRTQRSAEIQDDTFDRISSILIKELNAKEIR